MSMRPCTVLLACSVLLLGITSTAGAQSGAGKEDVGYGIKLGLSSANVAVSAEGVTPSLTSRIGVTGGGFVEVPIARNVAIQPELLLAMKGATVSASQYDETLALTYLDFPILVRYRFSIPGKDVGPYLYSGPVLGVLLTATGSSTVNGKKTDTNIKNQMNSVDIGLAFGGGVQFGRVLADARYKTVGFRSIFGQVQSNQIQGSRNEQGLFGDGGNHVLTTTRCAPREELTVTARARFGRSVLWAARSHPNRRSGDSRAYRRWHAADVSLWWFSYGTDGMPSRTAEHRALRHGIQRARPADTHRFTAVPNSRRNRKRIP